MLAFYRPNHTPLFIFGQQCISTQAHQSGEPMCFSLAGLPLDPCKTWRVLCRCGRLMCTPRGCSLQPLLSRAMVRCRWLMTSVAMHLPAFRYNSCCPTVPCPSLAFLALPTQALLCPAFTCPALPCPAVPCPALSCAALPSPSLPCVALPHLPLYVMVLSLLPCA